MKPAESVFLERRGYGQTDGLGGTAGIGHHQMGVEGVEAALHALYRGVERFEVNGDVGTGGHKKRVWRFREGKDSNKNRNAQVCARRFTLDG